MRRSNSWYYQLQGSSDSNLIASESSKDSNYATESK